jgi:hypothetical protein
MTTANPDPKQDSVSHINIYSKGATQLGRMLSNFYHAPFKCGDYGSFESVEGFWYYYFTGCKHERLRELYGIAAKKAGQTLRDDRIDIGGVTDVDKEVILEAIRCKLRQHKHIRDSLKYSELPFEHYYWWGEPPVVVNLPQYRWIIDEFERLRKILKAVNKK